MSDKKFALSLYIYNVKTLEITFDYLPNVSGNFCFGFPEVIFKTFRKVCAVASLTRKDRYDLPFPKTS